MRTVSPSQRWRRENTTSDTCANGVLKSKASRPNITRAALQYKSFIALEPWRWEVSFILWVRRLIATHTTLYVVCTRDTGTENCKRLRSLPETSPTHCNPPQSKIAAAEGSLEQSWYELWRSLFIASTGRVGRYAGCDDVTYSCCPEVKRTSYVRGESRVSTVGKVRGFVEP